MDKLHFNVDDYNPSSRFTLLHTVGKWRCKEPFSDQEKSYISILIKRSNNLFLKNNFGSTALKCAANC